MHEPDLPFECRLCRFCVPLDDVALLMSDGWRCVCYRCWRAAVDRPDPDPGPPHLPLAVEPGPGSTPLLRWWCRPCAAEFRLPLSNLRRPACPVCGAALRRWDEQFPTRRFW